VLQHLVDLGNSVIVIEHNLDFIKNADYIIDMGPEGGSGGGKIITAGNVEKIIKNTNISYTAKYLKKEI
jgi:excinuclease ABC subunit A